MSTKPGIGEPNVTISRHAAGDGASYREGATMIARERKQQESRTQSGRWIRRLAGAAVLTAALIGGGCYARVSGPRTTHTHVHGSKGGPPGHSASKAKPKKPHPGRGGPGK